MMHYVRVTPEVIRGFMQGAPLSHKEGDFALEISEAEWIRMKNYFGVPPNEPTHEVLTRWGEGWYYPNPKVTYPVE